MPDIMDVSKSTVFVVDDSPVTTKVISRMLKKNSDYYSVKILDGTECIKKAKEVKPDLILLDIGGIRASSCNRPKT